MLRSTNLRIIPAAIILFWLIMAGVFVYREIILPGSRTEVFAERSLRPQNIWMGIFVNGDKPVGFVNSRSAPEFRDTELGFNYGVNTQLNVPLFGRSTEFKLNGKAWISQKDGLRDFEFELRSGEFDMKITGEVSEGKLNASLMTADEKIPFTFPIDSNLLLGGDMGFSSMEMPRLEPGKIAYVETFDPTTMSVGKAKLECIGIETIDVMGEPVETYAMEMTIGGLTSRAWVTEEDEVVQASTPFGFTLRKISPEEAFASIKNDDAGADLIRAMAVIPDKPIQRDITMLKLRFKGLKGDAADVINNTMQTNEGDVYTIRQLDSPSEVEEANAGLSDEELADALAGDALVQVGHEKILAKAKEIVGEEQDTWKKAMRLYHWTYDNIEKTMVISLPSALDVLDHMKGDCNEHTVLYAALARSVEIPTRIAIGLVWSDELQGFGYHAWPEVYYGKWYPIDPTLGQEMADATHITLLYGSIDKWTGLIPYIGQLKVEILGMEPQLDRAITEKAGL